MLKELHKILSGEENKEDTQLSKYLKLPYKDAVKKAAEELLQAQKGQRESHSDFWYWQYQGSISRATLLLYLFAALDSGVKDFPRFPQTIYDGVLMDKCWALENWAKSIPNFAGIKLEKLG